ncbi:MAG TPA: TrkA C-terminal domain-containing protein [Vicinamibacterales bacterium]|jgi:putative transport protein|nr:TrkA C-terminal domain-containing protein [Vicinamibacterales bacterium]
MGQLASFLHGSPALCLFLSILLGHIIGRFHVKGVGFGSVVGTLIAGIVIGIVAKPELPELLRWTFFYLFLFSVGYSVGPQFFGSLKKEALPQVLLSVIVAVSGLATVIGVTLAFGFDEGLAVGLLSGGMTQSAALGTGLSAIAELPIGDDVKARLMANAPLADAITYGFGDLGLILFLTWLGPKMLRTDLKTEAKALEKELAGSRSGGPIFSGAYVSVRAHVVENAAVASSSLSALEDRYADARLSVHRVQRGDELLNLNPALTLKQGDRLVVSAQRGAFLNAERDIGREIDDPALLSVPVTTVAIVVTSREVNGRTLGELGQDPRTRGVYLESLRRGTELMPREPWIVLQRGDMLHVVGAPDDVERAAKHIGFVERDLSRTDLTFLAAGICAGMLLGLVKLSAGGMVLGLGTAGSILVVGLATGWARSRYPVFGAIPEAAQRLLMDIGLIVFIAVVGLQAGPHAVEAYRASGGEYFVSIFVAGMIVTIVPLAVGAIAGRYVLKMSPLMLLGGLAGAQTCTPGLTALREASDSNVGSVAYTVPYAIGNILLTVWGAVVVALVHTIRGSS